MIATKTPIKTSPTFKADPTVTLELRIERLETIVKELARINQINVDEAK